MCSLKLTVIYTKSKFEFLISVSNKEELNYITRTILTPFISGYDIEQDKVVIFQKQLYTESLRSSLKEVSEDLRSVEPKIFQLYNFFTRHLQLGEYFYLLIDEDVSEQQTSQIQFKLAQLNNPNDSRLIECGRALDIKLKQVYDVMLYNENTPEAIGEPIKEKRKCRYCKRTMPKVSFKKKAHTISEALGNKTIITNDECDECNQLFGDTLESDLISIFDFPRMYYKISGKNGKVKEIEGKNYILDNDPNSKNLRLFRLKNDKTEEEIKYTDKPVELQLIPKRKFPTENIYKCLVKYAIGVLDESNLPDLSKTIQWLKGEISDNTLPPIAWQIFDSKVVHPQIAVFVRKDSLKQELPHIFVFIRLINTQFGFIIPFSDKDTNDFTKVENFIKVLDLFEIFKESGLQIAYCKETEPIIKIISTYNNSLS